MLIYGGYLRNLSRLKRKGGYTTNRSIIVAVITLRRYDHDRKGNVDRPFVRGGECCYLARCHGLYEGRELAVESWSGRWCDRLQHRNALPYGESCFFTAAVTNTHGLTVASSPLWLRLVIRLPFEERRKLAPRKFANQKVAITGLGPTTLSYCPRPVLICILETF